MSTSIETGRRSRDAAAASGPRGSMGDESTTLFAAAGLALLGFHVVGLVSFRGFALDLGSVNFPPPGYTTYVLTWMFLGGLSAVLFARAVSQRCGAPVHANSVVARWNAVPEGRFLFVSCIAAFMIPAVIRYALLHGAPLTDDEGAYQFAAQLLASGRLWVASPPMKLFFDQNFMINDGRLYPVYFLGWPALLVPAVWMGAPGIMNPILSALTVPPLLRVMRHIAGPSWARGGVVLFLSAPFLQIAAATLLSHTSCLMALTWCLWMYIRTTRDNASMRDHAGFALSFALAFCIRPQSVLPIGLPLLVSWCWGLRRLAPRARGRAMLAFLLPTTLLGVLFLASLWAQNGSPWRVGYTRYNQYLVENMFRFTTFGPSELTPLAGFDFSHLQPAIARTTAAMFRLNADLFGWPASLALIVFARPTRANPTGLLWWMCASYLLLNLFQRDWGIDTFGPVHAFEMSLPLLVLTIAGTRNLHDWLNASRPDDIDSRRWPWSIFAASLLTALIVTAWLGFVPVRLEAARRIAAHVNVALRAPQRAGLHHAAIFAPSPFAPPCGRSPRHFVLFRPVNDPDLQNDVLWVNHVNIEDDRRFLETVRGRAGYILRWTPACDVELLSLTTPQPSDVRSAPRGN
ncbi:MAG TPA: hypothetical protein VFU28_20365 [Vicinamibacterales bacterium]|nr:hypothetical protein [Vicinamibacterales bacterium]